MISIPPEVTFNSLRQMSSTTFLLNWLYPHAIKILLLYPVLPQFSLSTFAHNMISFLGVSVEVPPIQKSSPITHCVNSIKHLLNIQLVDHLLIILFCIILLTFLSY